MKIYIRTFGCQMNSRDSETLVGMFLQKGFVLAQTPQDADVILVNTCSVRGHAEQRALSFLGSIKKLNDIRHTTYDIRIIGLIGCMAQNIGKEVFQKMPHVNLICGPSSLDRIPQYAETIQKEKKRIIDLKHRKRNESCYDALYREKPNHAQVIISVGCSNYCSYCVVPFVRGELYLRKPKDILDEVKRNADLGIKKITFLGQNVNDYQYQRTTNNELRTTINFVDLLRMAAEVDGIEEIDFVSSNPKNTTKELFSFMGECPKIKKQLHLPFQSGSDRILKLMNRGYTQEKYLGIINDYKEIVGGRLGADVIVGFPTETEEDFLKTKEVMEKVKFNYAFIFKYSPRPNTAASKLDDDVPKEVKEKRHKILLDLQKKIARK